MAQDLILFSLPEFGYFRLPAELCTGSSIMPQKKNPDALELTRAKSSTLSSYAALVKNVLRNQPSGYNRDLQETKEPYFRGLDLAADMVAIMSLTVRRLEVDPAALGAAFTPDIFATDAAFEQVRAGVSFRDAYRSVGLNLGALEGRAPRQTIADRTHTGAAGNLGLGPLSEAVAAKRREYAACRARVEGALGALAGTEVWEASGL